MTEIAAPIEPLALPVTVDLSRLPMHAARLLFGPDLAQQPLVELLEQVTQALRGDDGLPIDRSSWAAPMLHPEVRSLQLVWTADAGSRQIEHGYAADTVAMYARSPMRPLYEGEATLLRFRLDGDGPRPYAILDELAAEGYTDYLAVCHPAATRWERAPITWATRAAGGFAEAHVAALLALLPLLSLVLGLAAHRRRSRMLLTTYLGDDAATRVLDGHVRRGEMFDIEAAVCFCDLRDFTSLSQQLTQAELLALLDDAFGAVVPAVAAEQGDVLKFIGDAVLAVFRVGQGENARAVAVGRALRAVRSAVRAAEQVHRERQEVGRAPLRIGLSVHLGRVAYGNIGSPTRLDFTVIGAAVNLASRLEGLCRVVGLPVVLSEQVAAHLDPHELGADQLVDCGLHTVKGVPEPLQVFGLRLAPAA